MKEQRAEGEREMKKRRAEEWRAGERREESREERMKSGE